MTATEPPRADASAWRRPAPGPAALKADAALAVVLAVAATFSSLLYLRVGMVKTPAPLWLWVTALALSTLPLALRRRYPVPVAIVVAAGFFLCGQFSVPESLVINISLFLALYTVGAWEQRRSLAHWSQLTIGAALVAWLVVVLIVTSSQTDVLPGVTRSGVFSAYATFATLQIITNLLYFSGAYYFGERAWRTARLQARLESQGHELELERQTSAAQAVALDRLIIARELHDVVAHHVSVMGIQAAAARRLLKRDTEQAAAAIEVVEESAHAAVTELRGLLHTLRTPGDEEHGAASGIAQIPTLIAESQAANTPATLIITGTQRPLPMLVDTALYRAAQEALTNVRKHAGSGAEATVRLRFEPAAVELEVSDNGVRSTLAAGPGSVPESEGAHGATLGLRGMRERIGAVGGIVHSGRREQGGFMVRARVPLAAEQGSAT